MLLSVVVLRAAALLRDCWCSLPGPAGFYKAGEDIRFTVYIPMSASGQHHMVVLALVLWRLMVSRRSSPVTLG